MKGKILRVGIILAMMFVVFVGCKNEESQKTTENKEETTLSNKEKPTIKVYGKVIEYTSGPMMTDALTEIVKDKYNIDAIQVDWTNQDKVIRTGIASGDPCDIYNYVPNQMINFADMAVDLKPYLESDPEWKSQFSPGALEAGTIDGKILNVPWESNYTVVLANKTKLDELGIEIPDEWTMDTFLEICETIKNEGMFPFANATDLGRSGWIYRNAMLSVVKDKGKYEAYVAGELPLNGAEAIKALEATKILYDKGYMYPGEGAVTAKNDEIKAAFYQGDLLMMPEIAAGAKGTAQEAEFEVVTVPWPSATDYPAINGGYNGFFIPQNAKNIDAAVEVLKVLTSQEIQKIHAEQGYLPANVHVEVTDDFVKEVLKRGERLVSPEDPRSVIMIDYLSNSMMADLVLGGGVEFVADALEKERTQ